MQCTESRLVIVLLPDVMGVPGISEVGATRDPHPYVV